MGHTSEGFDLLAGRIWRKAARTVALSVLVNLSDWFNNDQCAMVASGDCRKVGAEVKKSFLVISTGWQTTTRDSITEGTRAGLPLTNSSSVKGYSRFISYGRFESDACFMTIRSNQLKQNQIEEIKRLLKERALYKDIAESVGCSATTVSTYARKFGVSRNRQYKRMTYDEKVQCVELYQNGMTLQQIAEKFGVHYTTVMEYTHRDGLKKYEHREKDSEGFPRGRPPEYTENMFRRAIEEAKEIAKVGEEYAKQYKQLIFHRAKQVKEILKQDVYKEIELWASVTE